MEPCFLVTTGAARLSLDPSCGRHQPLQIHDGASQSTDGRYADVCQWMHEEIPTDHEKNIEKSHQHHPWLWIVAEFSVGLPNLFPFQGVEALLRRESAAALLGALPKERQEPTAGCHSGGAEAESKGF